MADEKPHYFEVVMNSYSDGVLNQVVQIREYAATGGELTLKQMAFTKDVIPAMVQSFDNMSQAWQEQGLTEAAEAFEKSVGKKQTGKKSA